MEALGAPEEALEALEWLCSEGSGTALERLWSITCIFIIIWICLRMWIRAQRLLSEALRVWFEAGSCHQACGWKVVRADARADGGMGGLHFHF